MNDEMNEQPEINEVEIEVTTVVVSTEEEQTSSTSAPALSTPDGTSALAPEMDEDISEESHVEAVREESAAEPPDADPGEVSVDPEPAGIESPELEDSDLEDEFLLEEPDPLAEGATDAAIEDESSGTSRLEDGSTDESINATREEIKPVIECLLFVAEEPLPFKVICKVLGSVPEEDVQLALDTLVAEYDERGCGLEIREVAGGWRISTRPQNHDFIRKYLKTRPSARLSLPALETLAVIAYKQPITVPEILEIRGVSSSSAIKTLLEKRLIVTRGRKETVGRPMMYGTSRDFLIQFGLKDLSELPSIEDFEDLAQ